jgi:hypothetical protein
VADLELDDLVEQAALAERGRRLSGNPSLETFITTRSTPVSTAWSRTAS